MIYGFKSCYRFLLFIFFFERISLSYSGTKEDTYTHTDNKWNRVLRSVLAIPESDIGAFINGIRYNLLNVDIQTMLRSMLQEYFIVLALSKRNTITSSWMDRLFESRFIISNESINCLLHYIEIEMVIRETVKEHCQYNYL